MPSRFSLIALAVAFVALGIAAHAVTQSQSTPTVVPGPGPSASIYDALNGFETRLAVLEAARLGERGNLDIDPRLLERLDDLERRLKALTASPGASLPPPEPLPPDAKDGKPVAAGEPDSEAIEQFMKLRAAASRQERTRRNKARIDKALADLLITLTDEQRDQLVEAYGAFEGRRGEIWGEAKRSGVEAGAEVDWMVIIANTTRVIQREFTERISPFIPGADAERISASLNPGGK